MKSLTLLTTFIILIIVQFQQTVVGNGKNEECEERIVNAIIDPKMNPRLKLGWKSVAKRQKLFIKVNPSNSSFNGVVTIDTALDPYDPDHPIFLPKYIFLVVDPEVKIDGTRMFKDDNELEIGNQCRVSKEKLWLVELKFKQEKARYRLEASFSGTMKPNYGEAFYVINYGNDRIIAGIECDSSKVFPSLVKTKTIFDIEVEHPEGYTAFSSYRLSSRVQNGTWITSRFETPDNLLLTSNGVGITVTNYFDHLSINETGTECRVWSHPAFANERTVSAMAALKLLKEHERYTQMPSPFGKMDIVALPNLDISGRMLGSLMNVDLKCILWKEGESTIDDKFVLTSLVAHELAHIWFGTLVDPRFVYDAWVLESFADWMMYRAVDAVEPAWRFLDRQLIYTHEAYDFDARDNSESLPVVQAQAGYREPNRRILYDKGAAIVLMLERHVGEGVFQDAVRRFLTRFRTKVAVSRDFLNVLQEVVEENNTTMKIPGTNVVDDYKSWLYEPGFPYLKVERDGERVRIRQGRFLKEGPRSDFTYWHIPVTFNTNGTTGIPFLFKNDTMIVEGIGESELYKFNVDNQGFYIVWYDDWEQVRSYVQRYKPSLTSRDTGGLLLDIKLLTMTEKVEYNKVNKLIGDILNGSRSVITWQIGANLTKTIYHYMKNERDSRERFAALVRNWLIGLYENNMWQVGSKTDLEIRFASTIIEVACYFGVRQCLVDAKKEFDNFKTNNSNYFAQMSLTVRWPNPDVRRAIFCFGLKQTIDPRDLDLMLRFFGVVSDTLFMRFKEELTMALGCVRHPGWVDLTFNYFRQSFNPENLPYYKEYFRSVADNPEVVDAGWNAFQKYFISWTTLASEDRGEIVLTFAKQFSDLDRKGEIDAMLQQYLPDRRNLIQPQVEKAIDENRRWLTKCQSGFPLE